MSQPLKPFKRPIYVHIQDGPSTVYEKSFSSGPIFIGRSLTSDIPLPQYEWISRKHARIEERSDGLYIVDLGSSNGVKFNGHYEKEIRISEDVEVKIGALNLRLSLEKPKVPIRPTIDGDETIDLSSAEVVAPERKTIVSRPAQSTKKKRSSVVKNRPKKRKSVSVPKTPPGFDPDATVYGDAPSSHPTLSGGLLGDSGIDGLKSIGPNLPYKGIHTLPRTQRAIEVYVTWKGQVIDSYICRKGETVYAGREAEELYVPTIHGRIPLVDFRRTDAYCLLPTTKGYITDDRERVTPLSSVVTRDGKKAVRWQLQVNQSLSIDIGNEILIHIRYAPTPRQLSKMPLAEFDALMKQGIGLSTAAHLLLVLLAIFLPKEPAPKIKNLPPRIAKLLVEKPKPKPKPPEPKPKKPDPPKVAEKKPEPPKPVPKPPKKKVVRKKIEKRTPKKVVVKPNKRLKNINQVAKVASKVQANGPVSKNPPKEIKNLGALAALGALGAPTPNPTNMPVALNINPNAGGAPKTLNSTGLIGTLKSKGGKLAASGGVSSGVKTKGKGYGTGTGYGVQGVKGSAGSRGVAGAVIGTPRLMKVNRTEGLTQKQVMAVVKQNAGKIQQCYERALLSAPGLQGRVEYGWHITPSGKVKWAKVKNSSVRNADSLNNCVITVFEKMKFPAAKNGASTEPTIGFPFGRM